MSSSHTEAAAECAVKVFRGGQFLGSGFLVAPGRVLTCAHVAAARSGELTIQGADFSWSAECAALLPAERGEAESYPFPDLAVLQAIGLTEPSSHPLVWLDDRELRPRTALLAIGWSGYTPESGTAQDSVLLEVAGPSGEFLRVQSGEILDGMSGSLVLEPRSGRVVGIIKASRDTSAVRGGWIVPAKAVKDYLPDLWAENLAWHQKLHPGLVLNRRQPLAADLPSDLEVLAAGVKTAEIPDRLSLKGAVDVLGWWFMAVVVALTLFGGVLLSLGLPTRHSWSAWSVLLVGLTALVATAGVGWVTRWRWLRAISRHENVLQSRVNRAIAGLAREQAKQWHGEMIARGVQGSQLLSVVCRVARSDLFDHWPNILSSEQGGKPPDLRGDVTRIDRVFKAVPSGRLVILGAAGAGKSVAALRLALRCRGSDRKRLPVILPLASWTTPSEISLWEWVADRLVTEHPELAAPTGLGTTLAEEVATPENLLLILEGLDEMPPWGRSAALRALNRGTDERTHFVLTSRIGEYCAAVREADVIKASAAVVLEPLALAKLNDYLINSTRRKQVDGTALWQPVLNRLKRNADAHARRLRSVLSSPLMLGLALAVYGSGSANPNKLLEDKEFPTKSAIEDHLIGQLIPTVYSTPAGGRKRARWKASNAEHWLRLLAQDASRSYAPGRELMWWRWYARQSMAATAAAVCIVYTASVALAAFLPLHGNLRCWGMTLAPWVAMALVGAIPLLVAIIDVYATEPVPVSFQLRKWLIAILWRIVVSAVGVALAWWSTLPTPTDPYATGFPVPIALMLAVLFIVRIAPSRPTDVSSSTPLSMLRADRASAIGLAIHYSVTGRRRWCLEAVVLFPVVLLATWDEHAGAHATTPIVWASVIAGVTVITIIHGLTNTAWGRYHLAHLTLVISGRLPWRTMAFLHDAHARGILRQSGGAFQFRHARLQEHLCSRNEPDRIPRPRVAVPTSVVYVAQGWMAPVLAGIVLFVGTGTLQDGISQILRPGGPYAIPPAACSLLAPQELVSAVQGPPQQDIPAHDDDFPFLEQAGAWCRWSNASNDTSVTIATWAAEPTNDESASQVAQDTFIETAYDYARTIGDKSLAEDAAKAVPGVPCDWSHEFSIQDHGSSVYGPGAKAILLCQNVLIGIYYSSEPSAKEISDPLGLTNQLLHQVEPRALRAGSRTDN